MLEAKRECWLLGCRKTDAECRTRMHARTNMAANSRRDILDRWSCEDVRRGLQCVTWALTLTQTTAPSPALWLGDPWGSCKFAASLQIHNCELRTSLKILSGIGSSEISHPTTPNRAFKPRAKNQREGERERERQRGKTYIIICPCSRASRRIFIKPFLWCLPGACKEVLLPCPAYFQDFSKLPGPARVCTCEPAFWNSACIYVRDVLLCLWLGLLHNLSAEVTIQNITHNNMARRAKSKHSDTSTSENTAP